MDGKKHINAHVTDETVKAINKIREQEKRSFSSMVDILLAEAVEHRNKKSKK